MSLRSLIFREFRLAKKIIILQAGLLLSFIALTWGMWFSGESTSEMLNVIIIMIALISVMSLLMDENFKADVYSGWLNYSYALPIKPLTRVTARFIQRFSVVFASMMISLGNSAALCAFAGEAFGVDQIVWHIVILALVIASHLPNEIFLLRSRSGMDMKKMQTTAGLTMFTLMAAVIAGIFILNDVSLEKLANSESLVKLPVFTAGAFLWAVPLLIIMMAISFLASYLSLRSAYPNAANFERSVKRENNSAETAQKTALPRKTDSAAGLLYKELKQNRIVIIFAALTPIILTLFPLCFTFIDVMVNRTGAEGLFEMPTNLIIRVLMWAGGFFIISGLMSEVFNGDDKKLWAYFVVSTPQGVKGFIYRKYVITLFIGVIYMVFGVFSDHLLATMNYFAVGNELTTSMSSVYVLTVFLLMFTSAVDIPFTVRYGSKRGSILKMTVMILICVGGVAEYSLLPDDLSMKITKAVISFFKGETDASLPLIIACLLPYFAFAVFLLSYKISCKSYMKGVNEFVK